MPESEGSRETDAFAKVWKSQEEEKREDMHAALAPDELCKMAQSRERLNKAVTVTAVMVALAICGALLFNVYRIDQPWIRLGQTWMVGVVLYLFGPGLQRGGGFRDAGEPCARFLERQHQERRRGYLRIRNRLFLLIPGIAACWWGRYSLSGALSLAGSWLFVATGLVLVLLWVAFGKAAEKAQRDAEEVRSGADE